MHNCGLTSRWLAVLLLASWLAACQPDDGARVVTIGGTTTPNTPGEATWLGFKNRVEAAAGGRIRFRPLIYGQLGSEEQLLSSLRRGRIQYANLSAQSVGTLVPELSLLYAPSLFADYAEADYVYDRYLTDIYRDLLAARRTCTSLRGTKSAFTTFMPGSPSSCRPTPGAAGSGFRRR